jgi:hypothetical protein
MRIIKLFILIGAICANVVWGQLPGDAMVLSTNNCWKGRVQLRKEHRRYVKVRKREKFIARKYGAITAQRFVRKTNPRKPTKRKEKNNKIL